jgi:hypothetical protein
MNQDESSDKKVPSGYGNQKVGIRRRSGIINPPSHQALWEFIMCFDNGR